MSYKKFKVWDHEDRRADAVEIEETHFEVAAETFVACRTERYNPDRDPQAHILVESPEGTIHQVEIWMEPTIEYDTFETRTAFKDFRFRIWAEGEDFYWRPTPECRDPGACMDVACPAHGTELPKIGPFESWQKAFSSAQESANPPSQEDPNL